MAKTEAYDPAGNTIAFTYEAHRNVLVTKINDDLHNTVATISAVTVNGTTTDYRYDHLHRRIAKQSTVNSQLTTVHWIYDGWNIISEYTGTTLTRATLGVWIYQDQCRERAESADYSPSPNMSAR